MYSTEEFRALSDNMDKTNYDFWYVIDHLPIQHLHVWAERLINTKYLSNINAKYWLDLIDLVRLVKQTDIELTTKQKRYMAMLILSCWNDLEVDYVL